MNGNYTDYEVLTIFIDSVDELLSSDFLQAVRDEGVSTSWTWSSGSGLSAQRTGPRRESVKALLLTVRLFCQNNEVTSLQNISSRLANLDADTETAIAQFEKSRSNLNRFLDGKPAAEFQGVEASTNRIIFETFLYGEFAHYQLDKRRRLEKWACQPFFADLESQFDFILLNFVAALAAMSNACRMILKRNAGQQSTN